MACDDSHGQQSHRHPVAAPTADLDTDTDIESELVPGVAQLVTSSVVLIRAHVTEVNTDSAALVKAWLVNFGMPDLAVHVVDDETRERPRTLVVHRLDDVAARFGIADWSTVLCVNVGNFVRHWLPGCRYVVVDVEQPSSHFHSEPSMLPYLANAVAIWAASSVSARCVQSLSWEYVVLIDGTDIAAHSRT